MRLPAVAPVHTPPVPRAPGARWRGWTAAACLTVALTPPAWSTPSTDATSTPITNSKLDAKLFYQLLLGELQWRGGEPGAAYSLVLDAARRTQQDDLYRRAVDMALQARAGDAALTAARDWAQALPQAAEPHRYVLQILLALNRPAEVGPTLQQLIKLTPAARRNDVIEALPSALARASDKGAALQGVQAGLQDALKQTATAGTAWATLGRLQLQDQQATDALQSARRALAADPDNRAAARLVLELMTQRQAGAEALLRSYLERAPSPQAQAARIDYTRWLIDQQRPTDAEQQLRLLIQRQPELPDAWLLQGALLVQTQQWGPARLALERFLTLDDGDAGEQQPRRRAQAQLMLAHIAEQQGDSVGARVWLDRIDDPEHVLQVQQQRAALLARQGQLGQARELLRQTPVRNPDELRRRLVAEAQLLRDQGQHAAALEVYAEAVQRFPDEPDLLYEQAMTAEKADRFDEMERLLRQLMAQRPDYHHAFNALGYALADRNQRLPEAKALIEQALRQAPNDPFILDSLGWVEFRLGNWAAAKRHLQQAYQQRPDAEIAAHLGEVLWALGDNAGALKVWREALLHQADNDTLRATLQRLQVQP